MKSFRKPTGLCAACGKPTSRHVHQNCGEKMRRPKKPHAKASAHDIDWLTKRAAR